MQTKLTLRMNDALIKRAKAYARRSGKSLSELVADYFRLLADGSDQDPAPLPPHVRRLKGVLRGGKVDIEDYHRHLEKKHR